MGDSPGVENCATRISIVVACGDSFDMGCGRGIPGLLELVAFRDVGR